ncbi:MAG: DNA-binding protein [Clostridia bacterium]|nr:DNA-binding protein [Clostridia bacterium]
MSRLLDCYGAFLTPSSRNVLEQYINDDYSLSEIAERENISRQGVRDGIQRAKNTLTDMEEKLLVVDRTDRILAKLLKLEESLKASGLYNEYALLIDELKNICEEYYGI